MPGTVGAIDPGCFFDPAHLRGLDLRARSSFETMGCAGGPMMSSPLRDDRRIHERPPGRGVPIPRRELEMQYVISVLDTGTGSGTDAEMAAIDAFNDSLEAEGRLVLLGGLAAPGTAAVLDNREGAGIVTDGPFVELAEYVSGLWIVEAADRETALRLAAEGSRACNRRVELRAFLSPEG
jgi:hypothetical protein